MLGQHDAGLHDVQVVQNFRISVGQASRQEVRLLLVVTFETERSPGWITASSSAVTSPGATIFPWQTYCLRRAFRCEIAARFANQSYCSAPLIRGVASRWHDLGVSTLPNWMGAC